VDRDRPGRDDPFMIRNAILHLNNEQPLVADLFEAPSPGDLGLRCTNLRQLNGKRPVFVENMASIFFFPYLHIRFVEIPPGAMSGGDGSLAVGTDDEAGPGGPPDLPEAEPELEIDEDFLRRIREV
jgi:hypothetical protein